MQRPGESRAFAAFVGFDASMAARYSAQSEPYSALRRMRSGKSRLSHHNLVAIAIAPHRANTSGSCAFRRGRPTDAGQEGRTAWLPVSRCSLPFSLLSSRT